MYFVELCMKIFFSYVNLSQCHLYILKYINYKSNYGTFRDLGSFAYISIHAGPYETLFALREATKKSFFESRKNEKKKNVTTKLKGEGQEF